MKKLKIPGLKTHSCFCKNLQKAFKGFFREIGGMRKQGLIYSSEVIKNDLEGMVDLFNITFPEEITSEIIVERLKDKPHSVYLAKDKKKVVGFNVWYEYEEGEAYLWLHAVDQDYRRRGISGRFLDLAINETRKAGYSKLTLTTFDGFHNMIRRCRRKGFVRTKKEKLQEPYGNSNYAIHFQYTFKTNGNGHERLNEVEFYHRLLAKYPIPSVPLLTSK